MLLYTCAVQRGKIEYRRNERAADSQKRDFGSSFRWESEIAFLLKRFRERNLGGLEIKPIHLDFRPLPRFLSDMVSDEVIYIT